jgi:hypothetical protein
MMLAMVNDLLTECTRQLVKDINLTACKQIFFCSESYKLLRTSYRATNTLTGPVALGNVALIERQLAELKADERHFRIYRDLAYVFVGMLESDGQVKNERVLLSTLLNSNP